MNTLIFKIVEHLCQNMAGDHTLSLVCQEKSYSGFCTDNQPWHKHVNPVLLIGFKYDARI